MNKIALFDLDGTLADYAGAMERDLGRLRSPDEIAVDDYEEKIPYIKARRDMINRQPDWWFNLDPITEMFEVLYFAREIGYEVHVCTKGPREGYGAWDQKVRWCAKHLPNVPVIITRDKAPIFGDILVDDWPSYAKRWLKRWYNGRVLMPARRWNVDFNHERTLRFSSDLKPVRHALQRQYDLRYE